MVHALELCRSLLKSDGRLIDLHPTGSPPEVQVALGGHLTLLGLLQETDDFIEYAQANAALAQAIQMGMFTTEREGTFTYIIHASSVDELREFLTENWSDAILDKEIDLQYEQFLTAHPADASRSSLRLVEQIRITRLLPGS